MPSANTLAGSRVLAGLLICAAVLAQPSAALGAPEDEVIAKVTKMNKKAVEEYENLNFEEARKILKDALDVCAQNGLDKHPVAARTHIHLGVVLLAGFKQRDQALAQFRKALEIQPDIKVTRSLANPEIQEAFDQVAGTMGGAGGKADGTSGGIAHEPVTQGTQGSPIVISVTVDASLGAKKVVVAYRPDGATEFIEHELAEASPGNWSGQIPAVATDGGRIAYYVEAQNEAGDAIASKGSEKDPFIVPLKGTGTIRRPPPKPPEPREEEGSRWFFGMAVGSGIGWATGNGEVSVADKISPPGFAFAAIGHLAPEIGYFVKPDQLLLSAQLRFQYIMGPTLAPGTVGDCGTDMICSPAKTAVAGLARVTWIFGDESFHPYLGGAVGAGNIRHIATFKSRPPTCGSQGDQTCVDTIPSGPVFAGPAGGFFYDLTSAWALTLGVNTLFGFPKFTFNVDLNAGVAFRL